MTDKGISLNGQNHQEWMCIPFFTKALKARPVTAMGATHGIEGRHESHSRIQSPSRNDSQMREYGEGNPERVGLVDTLNYFFNQKPRRGRTKGSKVF